MMQWLKSFLRSQKPSTPAEEMLNKYGVLLQRKNTTKDQREEVIESLARHEPERAIPQLLKRYDLTIESGLQDQKEKQRCMDLIMTHKAVALPIVLKHIKTKYRIAWSLRILEQLVEPETYTDTVLDCLDATSLDLFDDDQIEKAICLLQALQSCFHKDIFLKVSAFIEVPQEAVRLTALECLAQHADKDSRILALFQTLAQTPPADGNSRVVSLAKLVVAGQTL